MIPNRIFPDKFYRACFLSDDEALCNGVAELYRLSFQNFRTDELDTPAILRHAIQMYYDYRVSYSLILFGVYFHSY